MLGGIVFGGLTGAGGATGLTLLGGREGGDVRLGVPTEGGSPSTSGRPSTRTMSIISA